MRIRLSTQKELHLIRNMTLSSALMAIGHIFFCYILFFYFQANKPLVYGDAVVGKNKSHALPPTCSGPVRGLRIVHKYGPCSPFRLKKSLAISSRILVQDERRVQALNSMSNNRRTGAVKVVTATDPKDSVGATDPSYSAGADNFLVKVGFGTPVKYFNLILDTGSSITWVRCKNCSRLSCPEQKNIPTYYPSKSSTSSSAPCGSSCSYHQSYRDKSYAKGNFVVDTLSIENDYVIQNFVFLCADKTKGFVEADGIDGILGLGPGTYDQYNKYSLTLQTAARFEKVFCHCLPKTGNTAGYVYFGKEALEKCHNSGTSTPLLSSNQNDPRFYYVNLIAITIGQKKLEISSDASSRGTIIDSGTVITRLPSSIYSALRSEFKELMSEFPPAHRTKVLDTCYNLKGHDDSVIPNMVLHFKNLDVNLDPTAVTWKGNDDMSQVCLAFAGKKKDDYTIFGSQQQQNLNILYNIRDMKLELGPGNC